jgi:iron complex outermembrane recepter protein
MYQSRLRSSVGTAVSAALVGGFLASPAGYAQQSVSGLEEIVVTARKREESLQEIPISITAFSGEQLRELGARNISELSDFTPGYSFETFGGRRGAEGDVSRPVIRGMSNILGEGNAAIFVDGIVYSESFLSFPFDIIERIEVIKGPQAAQFGRATFSGAINVITKRGSNEFENRVTGRIAQDDDYEINLSSRGPLIQDRLFYFVHSRYYEYGGEYRNEIDDRRVVGAEQSWGINSGLEWLASDDVSLRFTLGYNKDEDDVPAQRLQDRFANNCFLDQARQYYCGEIVKFDSVRLATNRLGSEAGLDREVLRATAALEWDLAGSGYVLSANTGIVSAETMFGNDNSYLGDPNFFAGGQFVRVEDSERDEISAELRLSSPGDAQLRYSLGVYNYDRKLDRVRRRPETQTIITNFGRERIKNKAVFGSLDYDVTDRLTAGMELRYQKDEIIGLPAAGGINEAEFTSTLPRFTLNYQHSDDLLTYGSIARGNKPGAVNTDPRLPEEFRTAQEEKSLNYELGVKSELFDNRLRLNAAVYWIDWTQQQLTQSAEFNDIPISLITNAGETRVRGVEVEGQYLLTDNWNFSASYALADATFREFCDPVQGAELTGFDCVSSVTGAAGGDVSGNQTPISPKHQLTAGTRYIQPLTGALDLVLRADYSYQTKKFSQVHNLAYVGDRHLLNLKIGLRADAWDMTFFVDNVLDDRTASTAVRFADLVNLNIGPNANPAQNNVPGTTAVERGFLVPLPRSRRLGVTFSYNF